MTMTLVGVLGLGLVALAMVFVLGMRAKSPLVWGPSSESAAGSSTPGS